VGHPQLKNIDMNTTLKIKKEYSIKNVDNLKPARKEQVLLLYLLNQVTSLQGAELIEHHLDVTIPMIGEYGESIYNVRAHLRWKKRKVLRELLTNHLELR
jgi:hypothetical protein